jgi:D-lyxose ketol-isomerase
MTTMLTELELKKIRNDANEMFKKAGVILSEEEKRNKIRIADYQPGNFYNLGLTLVTTVNTSRYCGRYLVFFPGQSCAQHWHPDVDGKPGKEETFRVLWGKIYEYVEGNPALGMKEKIPEGKEQYYTCRKEIVLNAGDQYTLKLHEKHWFQGGPEGAVALEVSSQAKDEFDLCSDPTLNGMNY